MRTRISFHEARGPWTFHRPLRRVLSFQAPYVTLAPHLFTLYPQTLSNVPPPLRPAYTRHNYANMWLATHLWRVIEPSTVLVVSIWLAYGSWERAKNQSTAAAVLGALVVVNVTSSAFLLTAGLVWGGAWRELPKSLSWPLVQMMVTMSAVLDALVLSQWSRLIERTVSTPVYAMLHTITCV